MKTQTLQPLTRRVEKKTVLKGILTLLMVSLLAPITANAVVSQCHNKDAKVQYTNASGSAASSSHDHYICVHKTKYYKENVKCSSGYRLADGVCKKTKAKKMRCSTGQKICSNSYCVGLLKQCKRSNKKGNATGTCTGAGWRASGNQCVKTKNATDLKCPLGWFKAKFGPNNSKLYCKTNR